MPIHDWTRVIPAAFHDLHHVWVGELRTALNAGILPPDYYAQAEQVIGPFGPDVLALHEVNGLPGFTGDTPPAGGGAGTKLAAAPPKVRVRATADTTDFVAKKKSVVIRHTSDDEPIALIEVVSPGNKNSRHGFRSFVDKTAELIHRGYHLLVIDLHPPGPRDPNGMHAAIWEEVGGEAYVPPAGEPLVLAAYRAGNPAEAFVEPTAVGRDLIDMPLFLDAETYVNVPLERTYRAAFDGMPPKWRRVLG